jgi:Uncharacterized protein conserved in bacteria (DUF2334)
MTMFLVRDDDPNATTDPGRLARAYAPLLDAGIPVSFSVIPRVRLDTRAPDGARERFLSDSSPDCDDERPLDAETPLVRWLRAHEADVDVFCHGLTHQRVRGGTEYGALTRGEAGGRIEEARAIFLRSLGRMPLGFVPPWDALSAGAIRATTEAFALVSTGWVSRASLPFTAWPAHVIERRTRREVLRLRNRSRLVRHRGGKISGDTRPEDVASIVDALGEGAELAVIVLHHWMFWERGSDHPVVQALADALRTKRVVDVRGAVRALR